MIALMSSRWLLSATPRPPSPEPDSPQPEPAPDEIPTNPTPDEVPPLTQRERPDGDAPMKVYY